MNSAEGHWSRGKWLVVVAAVFAAQVGLIFALGQRKIPDNASHAAVVELGLSSARGEFLEANDPTLFSLPHLHGFSGAAWLGDVPRAGFKPFSWSEPPRWLAPDATQLGEEFTRFMRTRATEPFAMDTKAPPDVTLAEIERVEPAQKSSLRVEGDLVGRAFAGALPQLPSWTASDLLTNSVVRVLVDAGGRVISPVLLPPGSGSKEADALALELAKAARFASAGGAAWTLGALVFQWRTEPMPETILPSPNP